MIQMKNIGVALALLSAIAMESCVPTIKVREENDLVPNGYVEVAEDIATAADISWSNFFKDSDLISLIDTALANNQELNIVKGEIEVLRSEVRARKGEYLPKIGLGSEIGVDKTARYTPLGANEATTEIEPGREMPDPVPNYNIGLYANWEVDIWRKLRNGKQAAFNRYIASQEGRNFLITNLVSEIADNYFELVALDNELMLINQSIQIQESALEVVRLQKQSGRVTELAVRRFEAQVFNTQSLRYTTAQRIVEVESEINFLVGRFPQHVNRSSDSFMDEELELVKTGIPSQLLTRRPDIRRAELLLEASKLDVRAARASFYPSLDITAAIGLEAFNPTFLLRSPESMLYSLGAGLAAPLVNRNAIKAAYIGANAKQLQAVYAYEQTILGAYIEVYNQMSLIDNLNAGYELRLKQVDALSKSVQISNDLFQSARADYFEVLTTQREALEAKIDLIDMKREQYSAMVNIYRAIGGGWY